MLRLVKTVSAAAFAAFAAASLYSLAVAAPSEGGAEAKLKSCENTFCLIAFF